MQRFSFSFTTFNLDLSSTNTDTYLPPPPILSPSYIHTYCILQLFLPQTTCTLTVPLSRDPDISWWIWRQRWEFNLCFLLPSLYLTFLPFRPLLSSSSLVCCAERERVRQLMCVSVCVFAVSLQAVYTSLEVSTDLRMASVVSHQPRTRTHTNISHY